MRRRVKYEGAFHELESTAKRWKEEGYKVFHNLVTSPCYDVTILEAQVVECTISDIKEEHPRMKVLEYKVETRNLRDCVKTYIVVKCEE